MILPNDVWSKRPTASRVPACSAADQGSQFGRPHEYSTSAGSPGGAKTLARSQPILEPNRAPDAASRWWTGERRNGRADSSSRPGHGTS